MESDLKTLPKKINQDDDSIVDYYVNKTPKQKSSGKGLLVIGIIIIIIVITISIILLYCWCQSKGEREGVVRIGSDTSTAS